MNGASHRQLRSAFLGVVPYPEALALQHRLREDLRRGAGAEHLLLLEHPHVITLGRSARRTDVVAGETWLRAAGVEVAECDRGGQVTYHGPGQLVGYPILDLSPDRRDVRRYVRDLQEVLVRTLADLGLAGALSGEGERIGVWLGPRKIASIGVHLSRWLTSHGFAINITTDLSFFSAIVPCGLDGVRMTSVERETGRRPAMAEAASACAHHFAEVFGRSLAPIEAVPSSASTLAAG